MEAVAQQGAISELVDKFFAARTVCEQKDILQHKKPLSRLRVNSNLNLKVTCFTSHYVFWKTEYIHFTSLTMGTFYRVLGKDGVQNIFEAPFLISSIQGGRTSFPILASPL